MGRQNCAPVRRHRYRIVVVDAENVATIRHLLVARPPESSGASVSDGCAFRCLVARDFCGGMVPLGLVL